MKILILGSGGREHALAWKCAQDNQVSEIHVAPGNAGTGQESKCQNVLLDIMQNDAIVDYVKSNHIDYVVVGPEAPLVNGVVDACRAAGIKIWGPTAYAAQLEGSKAFAKDFLKKYNIPTSAYEVFTDPVKAREYVAAQSVPIVIKADGLAAGKGVVVALTQEEAFQAIDDMLSSNKFGSAGARVVIEQFLDGEEASFICMIDGNNVLPMATSQDHKRIFEQDQGPNTGGMGAYSPAPVVTPEVHQKVLDDIIYPTINGLKKEGHTYTGFLYAGLMIDKAGQPRVIEFNCRFGDPETQPVMMRLQNSLVDLIQQGIDGNLPTSIDWTKEPSIGIVLAAPGYPGDITTGNPIQLPKELPADVKIFHAGTKEIEGLPYTNGGRVLCVTATGNDLKQAREKALAFINQIHFDDMQYRKDIGYRAIGKI